jgi:hypothetical protein
MRHSLSQMVESAWEARRAAPGRVIGRNPPRGGVWGTSGASKITSPERRRRVAPGVKPRRRLEGLHLRLDSRELHRCNWS